MADLGKKYTCYSCHTKFYDLGKPVPVCPKCGADQRDAEDAPATTSHRGRGRVVEEPIEEEFPAEPEVVPGAEAENGDDEEILPEPERAEEPEEAQEEDEDEDEEF